MNSLDFPQTPGDIRPTILRKIKNFLCPAALRRDLAFLASRTNTASHRAARQTVEDLQTILTAPGRRTVGTVPDTRLLVQPRVRRDFARTPHAPAGFGSQCATRSARTLGFRVSERSGLWGFLRLQCFSGRPQCRLAARRARFLVGQRPGILPEPALRQFSLFFQPRCFRIFGDFFGVFSLLARPIPRRARTPGPGSRCCAAGRRSAASWAAFCAEPSRGCTRGRTCRSSGPLGLVWRTAPALCGTR